MRHAWLSFALLTAACGSATGDPTRDGVDVPPGDQDNTATDDAAPGDDAGPAGDDGTPLITATLSAPAEVTIGGTLTLTLHLSQARASDTMLAWRVVAIASDYPQEYGVTGLPAVAAPQSATIVAGATSLDVVLPTAAVGLARAVKMSFGLASDDVAVSAPTTATTLTPRSTDVRQIAFSQSGYFELLQSGRVRWGNPTSRQNLQTVAGDYPNLAAISTGGDNRMTATTAANEVVVIKYRDSTTGGVLPDIYGFTSAGTIDGTVRDIYGSYFSGLVVTAEGPAWYHSDGEFGDAVELRDGGYIAACATSATGAALFLGDDGVITKVTSEGTASTFATYAGARFMTCSHSYVFVLTDTTFHAINYGYPTAGAVAVPNAADVIAMVSAPETTALLFADFTVRFVQSYDYTAPALETGSYGPFSAEPLVLVPLIHGCGLLVGNTVECL